jgi:methyl-accepting chemotaxis protein
MRGLNNASIVIKSLAAPLLSAIALIGIVLLFLYVYLQVEQANRSVEQTGELANIATLASESLTRGHASLYRAVGLKSQGAPDANVAAAKTEAVEAIALALKNLDALNAAQLGLDETALKSAIHDAQNYAKSGKDVVDVVLQDGFSAAMFMTDAEQRFATAAKEISVLSDAATKRHAALIKEVSATLHNALYQIGIGAALAVVLSAAVALFFGRLISVPIRMMTVIMAKLAAGDLSVEMPAADRTDEVGEMADAVRVFRNNAIVAQRLSAEKADEQTAKIARGQRLEALMKEFEEKIALVVSSLGSASSEIHEAAGGVATAAAEAKDKSVTVAEVSQNASINVQTVAAAAEELSRTVGEISERVQNSVAVAQRAAESASHTTTIMTVLSDGANQIGRITELINGIASQTNLLALNATIEAARAGEAGKGFAVVAGEIKSLATQTAKATDEITGQINAIQGSTHEVVTAIQQITNVIGDMNATATAIAAAVEQQGAATSEIARSAQEAADGTETVANNIAGVSTAVSLSSSIAENVRGSAEGLLRQAEHLRLSVSDFLEGVEAA